MLVLSRQRDETIMIGDEVEITIVDIRGDKVRLGINAPRHIQVHRKEVYEAIKRENAAAATVQVDDLHAAAGIKPTLAPGGVPVARLDHPRDDNHNGRHSNHPRTGHPRRG
jgi:carbon storage regulator